jgi:23S rRNA pseudouridine1911/1915/1917 synthase
VTTREETVPAALAGERVDRVVALVTGLSRARAAAIVEAGAVHLDGVPVTDRARRVVEGERLAVAVPEEEPVPALTPEPDVPFAVVHADEHVLVVAKPAGVVVHPGAGRSSGTLVHGLLAAYPDLAGVGDDPLRPGLVHRLDAGTSGLLVVARTAEAHRHLVAQLARRSVERAYLALTWGRFDVPTGLIDAPVGRGEGDPTRMAVSVRGRVARTRYEVEAAYTRPVEVTLLWCRLETGRTHQIRVHLAAIGHPVVGDTRYGGNRPALPLSRPFLHAARLAFDHPATGARVTFESPLPADLEEVRGRLA